MMVSTMKAEEIRNERVMLANMLIGKASNIAFSGKTSAMVMMGFDGKIELKARLAVDSPDLSYETTAEHLAIATDQPNFQRWCSKTEYHRKFMEKNLDSLLLAWCDPSRLLIPASYSKDVWTEVTLHAPVTSNMKNMSIFDRQLMTNIRDVFITAPLKLNENYDQQLVLVGTLEFPFSIMMIRELVMSYWQAFLEDSEQFYQHCGTCDIRVDNTTVTFQDKWAISFGGTCTQCKDAEVDMAAAVPKW